MRTSIFRPKDRGYIFTQQTRAWRMVLVVGEDDDFTLIIKFRESSSLSSNSFFDSRPVAST
jgi:hypothetical protein